MKDCEALQKKRKYFPLSSQILRPIPCSSQERNKIHKITQEISKQVFKKILLKNSKICANIEQFQV